MNCIFVDTAESITYIDVDIPHWVLVNLISLFCEFIKIAVSRTSRNLTINVTSSYAVTLHVLDCEISTRKKAMSFSPFPLVGDDQT